MEEFLPEGTEFNADGAAAKLDGNPRKVLDFWKWAYSDMLQNITRGYVVQFIVAWALGVDTKPNEPWRSYDVLSKDDKRIEVKSTSYLQSWTKKRRDAKPPAPQFKLEPTRQSVLFVPAIVPFNTILGILLF